MYREIRPLIEKRRQEEVKAYHLPMTQQSSSLGLPENLKARPGLLLLKRVHKADLVSGGPAFTLAGLCPAGLSFSTPLCGRPGTPFLLVLGASRRQLYARPAAAGVTAVIGPC